MARWRWYLMVGGDGGLTHDYGVVEADNESGAFAKGFEQFGVGDRSADDEARRIWPELYAGEDDDDLGGGEDDEDEYDEEEGDGEGDDEGDDEEDEDGAFFSVEELSK